MPSPKNILSTFADNESLMEAFKAVLVKQFELPKEFDPRADDALLGQKVRAYSAGLLAIDAAFKEIAQYKTAPGRPEKVNPAR